MEIERIDNIEYGRTGGRALFATLYRPAQTPALPAVVWIHGGAWQSGDRYQDEELCQQIARYGFACLSIDYRLSGEAIFPAAIRDCKCAVRYLRANAASLGIIPEQIGAWGASAGAHLAVLLGTSAGVPELEGDGGWAGYSSAVQAVCDWFGPTDFLRMSDFPSVIDHDAADAPESLFVGGKIQEYPERVQKANPITYISASTPPVMIVHGKQDQIVPFNQSELLVAALVAQGIEAEFIPLENAGHGGAGFEPDGTVFERCVAFMKRHLCL
ncbi:MAG: alpha/beta hydrolase [Anaerolineae bacterium]|nr:alpha/beta hydrolase [Anaerolineae bacterium]